MKPHLLIDGDVLRYRIGFASQKKRRHLCIDGNEIAAFDSMKEVKQFLEDEEDLGWEIVEEIIPDAISNTLHSVKVSIESMINKLEARGLTIYLSGTDNFRKEVDPEYKENRKDMERPFHYDNITRYLRERWDAEVVNFIEADDAMSIEQYRRDDTIICTIDKDLLMVPGWHYNFVTEKLQHVSKYEGTYHFAKQLLAGDVADNIPGIRGLGLKRAGQLLSKNDQEKWWCRIGNEYAAFFEDPESRLNKNTRLLWMLRDVREKDEPPDFESIITGRG